MSKSIAIMGVTGAQGGGVAQALLRDPSWKIRGITRNLSSDKAKALSSQGIEMVSADANDISSLLKAFQGATAVYGMTNFWDLIAANGNIGAGEIEYQQGVNIANAVSHTPSVQYYIFATLPSAEAATGGKIKVPHTDYKAKVDQYIKSELPELAHKTTFLWHGFYASNIAFLPPLKPSYFSAAGKHLLLAPVSGDTVLPITGDVGFNTGLVVKGILSHPEITKGRYTAVLTEYWTMEKLLSVWSKVTGKPAAFVNVGMQQYEMLWPGYAEEIGVQLAWNNAVSDWRWDGKANVEFVGMEELGVDGLVGAEETLRSLASFWE